MKHLSQGATKVFQRLAEGLREPGEHRTIDNAPGAFMPVGIELLYHSPHGTTYSINHHYIQNGDVMWDPMMEFLRTADGRIIPMTFEQSNPPVCHRAAWIEDGELRCRPKMQADIAAFANLWMKNILAQQLGEF